MVMFNKGNTEFVAFANDEDPQHELTSPTDSTKLKCCRQYNIVLANKILTVACAIFILLFVVMTALHFRYEDQREQGSPRTNFSSYPVRSEPNVADPCNTCIRPTSCSGVKLQDIPSNWRNTTGGAIEAEIAGIRIAKIYCDVETDGGNWTVFQRRMDGSVDFNRGWSDYLLGFGNVRGEFWLGLESIYQLTKNGDQELRVDMIEENTQLYFYAEYSTFQIGPSSDYYRLNASGYSGNATDGFDSFVSYAIVHNMQFSTRDLDRDRAGHGNCAASHRGGWWQNGCSHSNLNGLYGKYVGSGILWKRDKAHHNRMQFTEMKIRKKS